MKPSTLEWVKKAEADFVTALVLSRRRKVTLYDQVCFHCQQSAEKYLKARIDEAGLRCPRTHDLDDLLDLILPAEPLWAAMRLALVSLSDYAVEFRYPGNEATQQDAKSALKDARMVRKEVRAALGLPMS